MADSKATPILKAGLINIIAEAIKNPQVNGKFMYRSKEYCTILATPYKSDVSALVEKLKVFTKFQVAVSHRKGTWFVGVRGKKEKY